MLGWVVGLALALSPMLLSANEPPEKFEPYLRAHPDDEPRREAALKWYFRESRNFERLRFHTFQMITHHPSNMLIYFESSTEFLARPDYHTEVLKRLEEQIKTKPSSGAYWVLALTCERRAVPPDLKTNEDKQWFLQYNLLDSDASLPKHVDQDLVAKTIRYFKKAIELAVSEQLLHAKDAELAASDLWHQSFYSRQLMDFYTRLGQHADALEVGTALVRRNEILTDVDFLVAYGNSLSAAGKAADAKKWLLRVRPNDHEGFKEGPGCATVRAETALGLIEIERGDIKAAVEHLNASTKVQKCCHNTTKGFPTILACKVLAAGQPGPVVGFCQTVLRDFTPNAVDIKSLLARAKMANETNP